MLNLKVPNAVPMFDVYSQVVYALKASEVDVVVVGGKPLLKDVKLLTVDEAAAMAKAKECGKKVASSLKQ
jgi:5-methylthioadenosine/S-adenosylhomocysteine deaminase